MDIKDDILGAIGNTPLVRLNRVVEPGMAEVCVKCEFMNPAGAIKDRMAYHIIRKAEDSGTLKPGGTIVENTSGNTGMGAAMVAAARGYRCVFTIPDKMSQEKIDSMKAFGAEVIVTATDVPGDSPDHYVNVAKRIAAETPGSLYLNQYHNPDNIEAHYLTTGRELWDQTDGELHAFVAGTGTGGTMSGVSKKLKEMNPDIYTVGVDPIGSVHYHLFHTGTMPTPHVYKVEGLGEDIKCDAMDFEHVDDMRQVSDRDCFLVARRLVREEGLFCGGSSGGIVKVALDVARELGQGKRVVTILPDSASRYISKFLSDEWMRDYGFLETGDELGYIEELLGEHPHEVITVQATALVSDIVGLMREHGVSQIPVIDTGGKPSGMVHEVDLLRGLHDGKMTGQTPASEAAQPIGGLVYPKARIEELYRIFETDQVAIVVEDGSRIVGVISQIDLIEHLSNANKRAVRV